MVFLPPTPNPPSSSVILELGSPGGSSDLDDEKSYRTSEESNAESRRGLLDSTPPTSPQLIIVVPAFLRSWSKIPRSKPLLVLALSVLSLFFLIGQYSSSTTPNHSSSLFPSPSNHITSPTPSHLSSSKLLPGGFDPDKLAIMIEKRDMPTLIPILTSFLERIPPHWPFQMWYGRENADSLLNSEALREYRESGRLQMIRFPEEFIDLYSGDDLSRFLTRPWFWEQLAPAEHIFFVQSDSIICSRSNKTLDDFLGFDKYEGGYDWVGAPWGWRGYPTIPWGGNGGFSLRRRSRMQDLTERFTEDWERERPAEDYWFAHKLEETTAAFPTTDFAMSFAFESPPEAVIDVDWIYEPFGVHIGGGMAWGLCPGRAPGWGSEQVRKLLQWCPEAEPIIPVECMP